jgi:Tol biopolymer transport system component
MQSVDLQGNRVLLGPDSLGHLDRPRFSANGQFLFFGSVRDGAFGGYRSNADGSNPIALPFGALLDDLGSPSPDGQFVAGSLHDIVRVYSVPDGVTRPWSVYGVAPLWSPDGRWIAVKLLDTDIGVILDANTGAVVQDFGHRYPRAWSPDSQWLLVTEPSGLALLYRLSDGALVPLSSVKYPNTPLSWKASPPG